MRAHEEAMKGQSIRDPGQPPRVVEGGREGLGLLQVIEETLPVTRQLERRTQGQPEVDGLLACVTRLWQMWEGTERLLEAPHSLTMRRTLKGASPSLLPIGQGLGM